MIRKRARAAARLTKLGAEGSSRQLHLGSTLPKKEWPQAGEKKLWKVLSCYPPWGNKNHHIPGHGTKPHESSGICSGGLVAQVARRCVDLVIRVDTSEVDRQRSGDLPSMEVSFCLCTHISVYWNIYIYTWNPNDLYFWRSTPQNKVFFNQNKGHLGSRYVYIYITYILLIYESWAQWNSIKVYDRVWLLVPFNVWEEKLDRMHITSKKSSI